jgi:uncharacterized coiled-coil protein SlyX
MMEVSKGHAVITIRRAFDILFKCGPLALAENLISPQEREEIGRVFIRLGDILGNEQYCTVADLGHRFSIALKLRDQLDKMTAERNDAFFERDKAIAARDVYVERARIAEVNERAANDRLRSASEEIRRLSESRAAEVGVGGIDVLNESAEKVDEVTIVELTNRIVELNERIRNRDESIDSQGWTINSQGSTINSQRRVIDSQRSIIDMGNDKIDKLTAEIVEQNLTIESLKKELAIAVDKETRKFLLVHEKDLRIEGLLNRVNGDAGVIKMQNNKIAHQNGRIDELSRMVEESKVKLDLMRKFSSVVDPKLLEEKDKKIEELQRRIEKLSSALHDTRERNVELGNELRGKGDVQTRVGKFMTRCFGERWASYDNVPERGLRFFEEACELAQACGLTLSQACPVIIHVYGKPRGTASVEVGDVVVTLAALSETYRLVMNSCGRGAIARLEADGPEKLREKHDAKPDYLKANG